MSFIELGKPVQNAFVESFNGRFRDECLNLHWFQSLRWTIGALASHLWTGGESSPTNPNINQTYLQPFVSYSTKTAWSFTLNTESSYNWIAEEWSIPINFQIAKILRFGKQPVQLFGGLRYWADSPNTGPHDLGVRFGMTFLFPKKPPAQ